jgi:hypothetical protein
MIYQADYFRKEESRRMGMSSKASCFGLELVTKALDTLVVGAAKVGQEEK